MTIIHPERPAESTRRVPVVLKPDALRDFDAAILMRTCATWSERAGAHLPDAEQWKHRLVRLTTSFHVRHIPGADHIEVSPTAVYFRDCQGRKFVAGVES